jgi:hypothetical protein
MDHGTVIDEKALEAEDKAEVNSIEKAPRSRCAKLLPQPRRRAEAVRSTPDWSSYAGAPYGKFSFKTQQSPNKFTSTRSPAKFCNAGGKTQGCLRLRRTAD